MASFTRPLGTREVMILEAQPFRDETGCQEPECGRIHSRVSARRKDAPGPKRVFLAGLRFAWNNVTCRGIDGQTSFGHCWTFLVETRCR